MYMSEFPTKIERAIYRELLGLSELVAGIFFGVGLPLISHKVGKKNGESLIHQRANLQTLLVDGIQGLSDLLAFGHEKTQQEKLHALSAEYGKSQQDSAWISGLFNGLGLLFTNLAMWTVLVVSIPLVNTGEISSVMLGALALIALVSFEAVTPLPLAAQMLGESLEAGRRLFEIVDADPEIKENPAVIASEAKQSPTRSRRLPRQAKAFLAVWDYIH